jgi:transcriptional regulator with XRE-family HTH domain
MTRKEMQDFRDFYQLSQKDVSDLSGVSVAIIRNLEADKAVSDEALDQLAKFVKNYERFFTDMTEKVAVLDYLNRCTFRESVTRPNIRGSKYLYPQWVAENKKNDGNRRYVILWKPGLLNQPKLILDDLQIANVLAERIHELERASHTLVGSLERTEQYYNDLGENFRWGNFKAYGTHPSFYDSRLT